MPRCQKGQKSPKLADVNIFANSMAPLRASTHPIPVLISQPIYDTLKPNFKRRESEIYTKFRLFELHISVVKTCWNLSVDTDISTLVSTWRSYDSKHIHFMQVLRNTPQFWRILMEEIMWLTFCVTKLIWIKLGRVVYISTAKNTSTSW